MASKSKSKSVAVAAQPTASPIEIALADVLDGLKAARNIAANDEQVTSAIDRWSGVISAFNKRLATRQSREAAKAARAAKAADRKAAARARKAARLAAAQKLVAQLEKEVG